MTEIPYDAQIDRPEPDREALALAMTYRYQHETSVERYIRQQWEATCGANRVALDAWRRIWPHEARNLFSGEDSETCREIEQHLAEVAFLLDGLSETMLGPVLDAVTSSGMTVDMVRSAIDFELSADDQA